jgi:hypothetical protein
MICGFFSILHPILILALYYSLYEY